MGMIRCLAHDGNPRPRATAHTALGARRRALSRASRRITDGIERLATRSTGGHSMKHQLCTRTSHSSLTGFTLLLGLGVSSLTSACSGDYPLGRASEGQGFPSESAVDEATGLAVGLPAPDFTLDVNGGAGPGSLAF